MGYSAGILKDKVTVLNPPPYVDSVAGRNADGVEYQEGATLWANVTWTKGVKAMRQGALDAYDRIMVRLRWTSSVTRECRLRWRGRIFAIESFYDSYEENTVQITAIELTEG